jgi:hypothetical protein
VGERVALTLVVEDKDGKRETINVDAAIRPLNPGEHAAPGH